MNYGLVFPLLILYQFKHLLADYFLQGKYMLQKFKPGWDFVLPLLAHVGVHAFLTFAIALGVTDSVWLSLSLALLDASIHFGMDRLKAGPKYMGRWKPVSADEYRTYSQWPAAIDEHQTYGDQAKWSDADRFIREAYKNAKNRLRGNTYFWWALGFDQMVHHLTHYGIVWILVTRS